MGIVKVHFKMQLIETCNNTQKLSVLEELISTLPVFSQLTYLLCKVPSINTNLNTDNASIIINSFHLVINILIKNCNYSWPWAFIHLLKASILLGSPFRNTNLGRAPFSFIKDIAQDKDYFWLQKPEGSLEGPLHLPFPSRRKKYKTTIF